MWLLSVGGIARAYDRLVSHIEAGQRVLDLGCGTGALTLRAAARGAVVKGIDSSAGMLEIAAERVREKGLADRVQLAETGVAELDLEAAGSYDVVTSGLCFSELSEDELRYTLAQVGRILKPDGLLLVADEVRPRRFAARVLHALLHAPLAVITWLVTQRTTRPLDDLPSTLRDAGFAVESARSSPLGSFVEIVARKPAGAAT